MTGKVFEAELGVIAATWSVVLADFDEAAHCSRY